MNKENLIRFEKTLAEKGCFQFQEYCQRNNVYSLLSQINNTTKNGEVAPFKTLNSTFVDMFSDVLDFYKKLDYELYEKLIMTIDSDKTVFKHSEPKEKGGVNFAGAHGDWREIVLNPENTINGKVVMTHEFSHAISQRIQEMKRPKEDCIGEIESKFIEYVYYDYLSKNGELSEDEYKNFVNMHNNTLKSEATYILHENDVLNILKQIGPFDEKSFEKFDDIAKHDERYARNYGPIMRNLEKLSNFENENAKASYYYRYVVGELVGRTLFSEYKEEFEKTGETKGTIGKFKKFLDTSADINLEQAANMLLGENYMQKISKEFGIDLPKTK